MTTQVEIANAALIMLAGNLINSFDETSTEANAVNAVWDQVRRSELRKHPWNFAIRRIELARSTTAPVYEYSYRYAIPSECLRLLENYLDFDYKIEGGFLYTDESQVFVRYVKDEEDTTKWDPMFVEVMTAAMAFRLAYAIPRTASMIDRMRSYYEDTWMLATHVDSTEDVPDQWSQGVNPYIDARYND